jgi:D-serine deaminase-like pyridoxal phosphate-dependent protein
MKDWYTIRNADEMDTPALVFYPERIKSNINLLKTFVADPSQLRPHIKTNKSAHVVQLMLQAGVTKFKCATIAEAELLSTAGARDVLLAYQPVGPKAKRFSELQKKFRETAFSCLVDNDKSLSELSRVAVEDHSTIHVFIDINVGMNRTGIPARAGALKLYQQAIALPGINIVGLHVYDGHLRDADLSVRKQKCDDAFRPVDSLLQELTKATGKKPVVIAGGTPTFPIHAKREGVEASPGTFIFWDKGYQQLLDEQPFEFAALVVTRVISKPDDQTICLDLGHKSIASENPISNRVHFLNAPDVQPIGHSEEHMVLRAEKNHPHEVGDVFYGVPYHICPTVALYDDASVCSGGVVAGTWPILARKRRITI